MKIAFLFSGQYRYIPQNLFKYSISTLTNGLDYDIFCYSWDEVGESLDHREDISIIKKDNDSFFHISNIFSEFNLKKMRVLRFFFKLPKTHSKIFNAKTYHKGTIFALPQIYTLSKCYKLLASQEEEYDLIFRCRFDSIYFIH